MRRAARVDDNQARIVSTLRRAGVFVRVLSDVGQGFPDLLVKCPALGGELRLVEIKDGSKPPSARKLTEMEEKFKATWGTYVVNDEREALAACGVEVV